MTYKDRLKKVSIAVARSGIDGVVVSKRHDIEYLTGFFSEGAMLFVSVQEAPVYFIDRMNENLARRELEGTGIHVTAGRVLKDLSAYFRKRRIRKVGIYREDITVSVYCSLFRSNRKWKAVQAPDVINTMRVLKDDGEIAVLRAAGRETAKIWRDVRGKILPGVTEREIAVMIDANIRGRGSALSFPTIAAVGVNTQDPHAVPTDRRLRAGEHALLDFGVRKRGYCSDLTRIWVKGRMNRKIRELRKCVDLVHDDAIRRAAPGVKAGSLAKRAQEAFVAAGLGKYIYHGLGHGVGLDIHEPPFLRIESTVRLKKGMVVTIEPGLYIPGLGGIRKEDTLLITSKGSEVLTR
ncbi:MAG: Xaa-Pro peptidase family protein [Candidatus Omnitrophica bacterium]|nr:Xaa-Pro peptidase family protein [Candidatus Omnitrophota bacterium]MBU1128774.1 Xaa-Pro peptidase family protein [Candidatus Omnitrophota bacterium]MBU1785225.1 Xaa-Pro peptidase family protein [Candidatus Omnitrophota bacterium]MBU1851233.1 Xaa-Pro peptidase family protein [Candidatus Omnitrophota bacterium]